MTEGFNPLLNYEESKRVVGYVPRKEATRDVYSKMGFKCGLEIHQQLKTEKKLFCRCPSGLYHKGDDYDAEIIRHMRPTLSELGEYDGTALMEFKTRKKIIYRIKNESACTYDIDDTPPFPMNREALRIAMEMALLLKTSIVGELHITRKQYLDGSIPTGFQRTAIVGIDGEIQLRKKKVRIIQLSIEEDACREVSDVGHERIYTTDRLGMPLIETVTYPDLKTPDEAEEAADHIRFLSRSTGKVNTGIGAAREDVNVSITGGRRVEIKGVAHVRWIPELTHNEAFRQRSLLIIREILKKRIKQPSSWKIVHKAIDSKINSEILKKAQKMGCALVGINLPGFKSILSFFTQPGRTFGDEISDRLKVIACIEKPNMVHTEMLDKRALDGKDSVLLRQMFGAGENDAQIIVFGPEDDMETAIETVEERCLLAFEGVPNETRKPMPDGTTLFERVLPGPDRMYPDTDSAPIPIDEAMIESVREGLPENIDRVLNRLREWKIPEQTYRYIMRRNLFPIIRRVVEEKGEDPRFIGTLLGEYLKYVEGQTDGSERINNERINRIIDFVYENGLHRNIIKDMIKNAFVYPERSPEEILEIIGYEERKEKEIISRIPELRQEFKRLRRSKSEDAEARWIMGRLRPLAIGNIDLRRLRSAIDGDLS